MINVTNVPPFRHWPWEKIAEVAVATLVAGAVFWKGGKTLESTWVLVGVAWLCTITYWKNSMVRDAPPCQRAPHHDTISLFLWLSVIFFIVWTAVSYRYSTTQNYGLDEVLQTGALGLIFLWVIRNKSIQNRLLNVVAWITVIACVIGVFVYVLQPVNRFVGTFVDPRFHTDYWPNAWAEYLLLAWPIVLYGVRKNKILEYWPAGRSLSEGWSIGILGFVLGCLLLSYSRAAIVAFGGQLVLWWILLQWQEEQSEERLPWKMIRTHVLVTTLIAGGVFFCVNGIRGSLFEVQNVLDKAVFSADEGYSSVSERQQFWNQAMEFMWRSPIIGWGPYSFRFVQPHIQEGILATSDHPHNALLKFGMERGVPAMVFFILIIGGVVYQGIRKIRHSALSVPHSHLIPVFVSIIGVFAHNMVDYNLQFIGIALPFWLFLGILVGENIESDTTCHTELCRSATWVSWFDRAHHDTVWIIRAIEVLLASVLVIIALFEGRFLFVSSLGRHAEARGEDARAMLWYNEATGAWLERDLQLSRTHLLINKNSFEEGLMAIEEYLKRNVQDYRVWKMKGEILRAQGKNQDALFAYEKALLYGKENDLGILGGLIETRIALNQWDELRDRLPEIENEMERFAKAIEYNIHFIALGANVEEYLALSNRLAELFPKDAPRYQLRGARIDRIAAREREKVKARPVGRLW